MTVTLLKWFSSAFFSSNHPKSRKAIVTELISFALKFNFQCSNHPKSRKAIVTLPPHLCPCGQNKFQSPQKPKGDCDLKHLYRQLQDIYGSNHPKSRKAIVTKYICIFNWPSSQLVPITPKAERRLWHFILMKFKGAIERSNHPKSRKAIVTIQSIFNRLTNFMFQSPQKPKGDCDSLTFSASSLVRKKFQSPQKPKGDCDKTITWGSQ